MIWFYGRDFQTQIRVLTGCQCSVVLWVKRLRENLADFKQKHFQNLYQSCIDGLITGHVLVQHFEFMKRFLLEAGQGFPQSL
jgi:hypothetical protein